MGLTNTLSGATYIVSHLLYHTSLAHTRPLQPLPYLGGKEECASTRMHAQLAKTSSCSPEKYHSKIGFMQLIVFEVKTRLFLDLQSLAQMKTCRHVHPSTTVSAMWEVVVGLSTIIHKHSYIFYKKIIKIGEGPCIALFQSNLRPEVSDASTL